MWLCLFAAAAAAVWAAAAAQRCSSQVEVVNDERLLEALPLSYLSLLLTGDFHPCPSALLSARPPLSRHCAPPGKRSISPPLAHLSARLQRVQPRSSSYHSLHRAFIWALQMLSNETLGPAVNS